MDQEQIRETFSRTRSRVFCDCRTRRCIGSRLLPIPIHVVFGPMAGQFFPVQWHKLKFWAVLKIFDINIAAFVNSTGRQYFHSTRGWTLVLPVFSSFRWHVVIVIPLRARICGVYKILAITTMTPMSMTSKLGRWSQVWLRVCSKSYPHYLSQ